MICPFAEGHKLADGTAVDEDVLVDVTDELLDAIEEVDRVVASELVDELDEELFKKPAT